MMLEKGYLATTAFYVSYAQKDKEVDGYLRATEEVFSKIARAVKTGEAKQLLKGPVCHSGFARLA